MNKKNQWLIKDKEGLIKGPFSTSEVLEKIKNMKISGKELISLYPKKNWVPIKDQDSFYDVLFNVLSEDIKSSKAEEEFNVELEKGEKQEKKNKNELFEKEEEKIKSEKKKDEEKGVRGKEKKKLEEDEQTETGSDLIEEKEKTKTDLDPKKILEEELRRRKIQSLKNKPALFNKKEEKGARKGREEQLPIEWGETPWGQNQLKKKKNHFLKAFFFLIFFSLGLFFLIVENPSQKIFNFFNKKQTIQVQGEVSLFFPKKLNQAFPKIQTAQMIRKGLSFLEEGTFETGLKAMNEWATALQGSKNDKNVLAFLCISYFKLWPFTSESSKELQAVSKAFLRISYLYPLSLQAYVCENVLLRLKEKNKEVKSLMKKSEDYFSLLKHSNQEEKRFGAYLQNLVAFLFYFQALDFEKDERFGEAYEAITYAQKLWPRQVYFYTYEAWILERMGRYSQALNLYEKILKRKPSHKRSFIHVGFIKASYMNAPLEGENYLRQALSLEGKVSDSVLAKAYFGLSHVFFQRRELLKAFEYAKKSYHLGFKEAESFLLKLDRKKRTSDDFLSLMKDKFLIEEGNYYLKYEKYHEAEIYFSKAYKKNGSYIGKAAFKVGLSFWGMNLKNEALKWFKKALTLDPYNEEAYFYVSDCLGRFHDFQKAEKMLSQALVLMPRSYILLRAFALLSKRKKNFNDLVTYAEEALQLYELDLKTYPLLVDGLIALGRFNEAFSYASRAMEVTTHLPFVHRTYARALSHVKGQGEAIQHLQKQLQYAPNELGYLVEIADLMTAGGNYAEAKNYYFMALEKNPKLAEVYFKLGKMYKELKYWEEAIETFFKALSLDQSDANPLFEIAKVYLEIGNKQEAIKYFEKTLQLSPKYPLAHISIGEIELKRNRPGRAVDLALKERRVNPYLLQTYSLAARGYYQLKQYNLCFDEYQKALKQGDKRSKTYIDMARCARLSGALDVALSLLNVAESLESGNPFIYRELGFIFESKGELKRAILSFNKYFSLYPDAKDRFKIERRLRLKQGK